MARTKKTTEVVMESATTETKKTRKVKVVDDPVLKAASKETAGVKLTPEQVEELKAGMTEDQVLELGENEVEVHSPASAADLVGLFNQNPRIVWSNARKNNKVKKNLIDFPVRVRFTNELLATMSADENLWLTYINSLAKDAKTRTEEIEDAGVNAVASKGMTVFPVGIFFVCNDGRYYDPNRETIPADALAIGHYVKMPFMWDYQWRGGFKEAIAMLQRSGGKAKKGESAKYACSSITAYKKVVDGGWFVKQRRIPLFAPATYLDELGNEHPTFSDYPLTDDILKQFNGDVVAATKACKDHLPVCSRPLRAQTMQGERVAIATSEVLPEGTECWFTIQISSEDDIPALMECLDFKSVVGMLQWRASGGKGTLEWTYADEKGIPQELPEKYLK